MTVLRASCSPAVLLAASFPALLGATVSGQRLVLEVTGSAAEAFGTAVAGVGDVDLDGRPDFLVGAPDANQAAGRIVLFSGRDGRQLLAVDGAASADRLGQVVGRLGDVDRDGRPDLLGSGVREAIVVSGASGVVLQRLPSFRACGAGDADGDGHADVAVARRDGPNASELAVISGRTFATIARFTLPVDHVLQGMDGAGDADADGRDDLVLGFEHSSGAGGRAIVFSPARTAFLWEWATSPASNYVLGKSVAGCGDFDGDGHADVAVGLFETPMVTVNQNGGRVIIYSGRTGDVLDQLLGSTTQGRLSFAYFRLYGQGVAGGGDLDGNGRPDVLAYEWATDSPPRLRSSTGLRVAPAAASFAFCGDVDRDGFDEVVVGDAARGVVQVIAGPGASTVRELEWPGGPLQEWDSRLLAARSVGDQNGDGVRDVLVARKLSSGTPGPIYHTVIVSGRDGAELASISGTAGFTLEATLATLGDVDGDQREDFACMWHFADIGLLQLVRTRLGELQVWSGSVGFGPGLAGGADWNGDGTADLFLGTKRAASGLGTVEVRSGADLAVIHTITGNGGDFGQAVCMTADVDNDGIDDLLVAAPLEGASGVLRLYGSAARTVVWSIPLAPTALEAIRDATGARGPDFAALVPGVGIEVRRAIDGGLQRWLVPAGFRAAALEAGSDVDGDRIVDFVVGDPALSRARIVSGADARTLLEVEGYPDGLGAAVAWIDAVDGALQAAAMSVRGGTFTRGYVRLFRDDATRARLVRYGLGCRTALPAPDLTLSARPQLGSTPLLLMRALEVGAPAALLVGASESVFAGVPLPLRLHDLGAPACVLWTSVDASLAFTPSAGSLAAPWSVPDDPALLGSRVFAQVVQLDPSLMLRSSSALRLVVGR